MNELVDEIAGKKPVLLNKYVQPLVYRYIEDSRLDMRSEITKLTKKLSNLTGNELIDRAPASKLQIILSVLNSE